MRARLTKLLAGLTVIGALAFGGASLASAQTPPANPPAIQQGDQTAPDVGSPSESTESASSESTESASSESAAASDGPGGHADDPANASLDYQFEGVQ
jgi:cytoskeletal protein RodZ